jgi:hypothetical protein
VRDVIDLSWEIFRLRRLKSGVLRIASSDRVSSILKQIDPPVARNDGERRRLASSWANGVESERQQLSKALETADVSMEKVLVDAFASKIDCFERLDRMLASAELRRNSALYEIERRRAARSAAVRRSNEEFKSGMLNLGVR